MRGSTDPPPGWQLTLSAGDALLELDRRQQERARRFRQTLADWAAALFCLGCAVTITVPQLNQFARQALRIKPVPSQRVIANSIGGDSVAAQAQAKRQEIVRLAIKRTQSSPYAVTRAYIPALAAQCANFVRDVLAEAGVRLPVSAKPVDSILPTGYSLANGLAGDDIGTVIRDPKQLRPGDLVFWKNTYSGWWPASAITHVGFYIGNGQIADKGNRLIPYRRSFYDFPAENFVAGIRIHDRFLVGSRNPTP
ncbi:MAG: C40 family peptidase [Oscillatoria princeps RMCB-10]|jgi:hypothetical protein|nr:C40 family peptidase [Oscillatoria princeps RMCB-10]